ncbi:hypothetical protein BHE74_00049450 [Ensete ventricosum]|nr:hypothetical protein BHE74_00049450 [Ensete ventricosum]RZR96584.1 hypothetical protein BHM03_00025637 [Ensete ventricosum]
MVLWPFRLIADKLVKMIGRRAARHDAGGDEEEVEEKEGRLFSPRFDRPVSCRSRFVDVGPSCAAAIRLGLRPRLRVDGLEDHRVGTVRHPRPREALLHHKGEYSNSNLAIEHMEKELLNLNLMTFEHIQEQLQDDIGRVNGLFEKALEAGISIQSHEHEPSRPILWDTKPQ